MQCQSHARLHGKSRSLGSDGKSIIISNYKSISLIYKIHLHNVFKSNKFVNDVWPYCVMYRVIWNTYTSSPKSLGDCQWGAALCLLSRLRRSFVFFLNNCNSKITVYLAVIMLLMIVQGCPADRILTHSN